MPPFNWAAAKGPRAPGSKTVPEPKSPECLLGLSFVFTGELSSFSRDEAIDIAKRYGGWVTVDPHSRDAQLRHSRVTIQPSSKTSYVVLGDNAGPSKLAAIEKHGLKTLSEDEFLSLIGTRVGPGAAQLDDKTRKKMAKEADAIKSAAMALEKREKQAVKEGKATAGYVLVSLSYTPR